MIDGPSSSVRCVSNWYSGGRRFDPLVQQHSVVEICHEIISTAILSLLLIQEGQNGVLVNCLGLSLPRKNVDRLNDPLDMTILVDWDVKQHFKLNVMLSY